MFVCVLFAVVTLLAHLAPALVALATGVQALVVMVATAKATAVATRVSDMFAVATSTTSGPVLTVEIRQ